MPQWLQTCKHTNGLRYSIEEEWRNSYTIPHTIQKNYWLTHLPSQHSIINFLWYPTIESTHQKMNFSPPCSCHLSIVILQAFTCSRFIFTFLFSPRFKGVLWFWLSHMPGHKQVYQCLLHLSRQFFDFMKIKEITYYFMQLNWSIIHKHDFYYF